MRRATLCGHRRAAEHGRLLTLAEKPNGMKNPALAKRINSKGSEAANTSKRFKRISPVSKRRLATRPLYLKLKRQWWKEQVATAPNGIPRCQVPGCRLPASRNPSHRCGRIGSLEFETRLWDRLCPLHYAWPENNPGAARACGLAAPKGLYNTNPFK